MTESKQAPPPPSSTSEMRNGRWNTVGVPTEKSKDFKGSVRRLLDRMGPERPKLYFVLVLAVAVSMIPALHAKGVSPGHYPEDE